MYPYNVSNEHSISPEDEYLEETSGQQDGTLQMPASVDRSILELILEAMKAAKENVRYYGKLSAMLQNPEDAEIIRQMKLDEQKHDKLFSDIYCNLTGKRPVTKEPENKEVCPDVLMDFQRCLFDALKEVELNRVVYFSVSDAEMRNMLFEIMTDEQAHAIKFQYLFAKYK